VPVPDGCLPAENKIYALITVGGVLLPALIAELGPLLIDGLTLWHHPCDAAVLVDPVPVRP